MDGAKDTTGVKNRNLTQTILNEKKNLAPKIYYFYKKNRNLTPIFLNKKNEIEHQ
jgi:hypothetical protein